MQGKIQIIKRYTRDQIRRNPDSLFVFGDNLARAGYGGQAAEARGEPNSVGIPTKLSPGAFMSDLNWDIAKPPIVQAFSRLANHLSEGKTVVWPADGVGTGLAALPQVAPEIFEAIERCRETLFTMASSIETQS